MGKTKNIIFLNKKEIPDKIKREVRWWDLYAKLSPIAYLTVGFLLWHNDVWDWHVIAGIGAGVFAMTAVTWWFWTVHTIGQIADRTHRAESTVQEVLHDIRDIKELVKQIRKS
jgi:hypothetical protein